MVKKKNKSDEPASPPPGEGQSVKDLLAAIDESRRTEIIREEKRANVAQQIAELRVGISQTVHRLEDGRSKLNFETHPFQIEILKDPATDVVLYGAAQGVGKTEVAICHAVASAVHGLKMMWVISKQDKRNRFVASRIDPCFQSVPTYKRFLDEAKKRGADSDSTSLKHFGDGSINFVYATAKREFTSYPADTVLVDEHQECDQQNIKMLDDRMSGSPWGFMWRVGHPTVGGTEENANLDYLYLNSDQRVWHIPCGVCSVPQEILWEQHIVHVERNKSGGIISVKPRDRDWVKGGPLDLRPICRECGSPMNRLSRAGFWKSMNPGAVRHGYQLSNIVTANRRVSQMYERFLSARHNPNDMQEFWNKQLGKPMDFSAEKITESMISNIASGESNGVAPYIFRPVSQLEWKRITADAA